VPQPIATLEHWDVPIFGRNGGMGKFQCLLLSTGGKKSPGTVKILDDMESYYHKLMDGVRQMVKQGNRSTKAKRVEDPWHRGLAGQGSLHQQY
jgi:hypothetical protein